MRFSSLLCLLTPSLALAYYPPSNDNTPGHQNNPNQNTDTPIPAPPDDAQQQAQALADAASAHYTSNSYYGGDMTNDQPHWHPPPAPPNTPNPPEEVNTPILNSNTDTSSSSSTDTSSSSSKNQKRAVPPHPREWNKPPPPGPVLPSNANTALACPNPDCRQVDVDRASTDVTNAVLSLVGPLVRSAGPDAPGIKGSGADKIFADKGGKSNASGSSVPGLKGKGIPPKKGNTAHNVPGFSGEAKKGPARMMAQKKPTGMKVKGPNPNSTAGGMMGTGSSPAKLMSDRAPPTGQGQGNRGPGGAPNFASSGAGRILNDRVPLNPPKMPSNNQVGPPPGVKGKGIGPMDAKKLGGFIAGQNPGRSGSPQGQTTGDAGKKAAKNGGKKGGKVKRGIGRRPDVKPKRWINIQEEELLRLDDGKGHGDTEIIKAMEEKKW